MNDFNSLKDAFEMAEILESEFEEEKNAELVIKVFDDTTEQEIDVTFSFINGDLDGVIANILG